MKKRLMSMLVIAAMALATVGCASTNTETKANEAVSEDAVKIGVIQYVQHGSLDDAYKGFVDGLAEAGYVEGENLVLDFQNASGEVSNCQQICDLFVNNNTDLVLSIATPAAQAAVNACQETEIPVLFTAVTDAVGAGLVESNEAPGKNVTGTSDMPVIEDQIAVIKKSFQK